MANKKSIAFFEAGSWYHRVKLLQEGDNEIFKKRRFSDGERSRGKLQEMRRRIQTGLSGLPCSSVLRYAVGRLPGLLAGTGLQRKDRRDNVAGSELCAV